MYALRRARLMNDACVACGRPPGSVHHIVQKGSPHFGDDVVENLVLICGSGTSGCHGAHHGNPYIYARANSDYETGFSERRDAEWVNRRIGMHLVEKRPDVIGYVLEKLGPAGAMFLERTYYLRWEKDGWIASEPTPPKSPTQSSRTTSPQPD